jgi:hypothetical protein
MGRGTEAGSILTPGMIWTRLRWLPRAIGGAGFGLGAPRVRGPCRDFGQAVARAHRAELRDGLEPQVALVPAEVCRPIESVLHDDLLAGAYALGLPLTDLELLVPIADREIVADGPLLGLGEEARQVCPLREGPVDVAGLGRLHSEALVPEGDIDLLEEAVGVLDRRDAGHPEFFNQAVLGGPEVPFHAALGLGRVGEDELDVEGLEGALDDRVRLLGLPKWVARSV